MVSMGTEEIYLRKQWAKVRASWESSFPTVPRKVLGFLPKNYLRDIWAGFDQTTFIKCEVSPLWRGELSRDFDLVFYTFSMGQTSMGRSGARRWIAELLETPAQVVLDSLGVGAPFRGSLGTLVYNGRSNTWTRMSCIGGRTWLEYPNRDTLEVASLTGNLGNFSSYLDIHPSDKPFEKPILKNFVPLGRIATWNRKYMAHHAYLDAYTAIRENLTS
jgi:hypothetical protein